MCGQADDPSEISAAERKEALLKALDEERSKPKKLFKSPLEVFHMENINRISKGSISALVMLSALGEETETCLMAGFGSAFEVGVELGLFLGLTDPTLAKFIQSELYPDQEIEKKREFVQKYFDAAKKMRELS